VRSWLNAGATCVGLGSALVGATPPATPADLRALTERARRVVRLAGRR
jgi:2-keto-3-deoxy-6-phosphogluconate aldolase